MKVQAPDWEYGTTKNEIGEPIKLIKDSSIDTASQINPNNTPNMNIILIILILIIMLLLVLIKNGTNTNTNTNININMNINTDSHTNTGTGSERACTLLAD